MAYADYEFYTNVYYGDQISEEDFPRLSERASDYIRGVTNGISDKVTGDNLEAVKKAMCAIAEVIQSESTMAASVFSGDQTVSSETVGSWSKSYRAVSLSATETEYLTNQKRDALLLYLGNLAEFAPIFKVRSYPCVHRA